MNVLVALYGRRTRLLSAAMGRENVSPLMMPSSLHKHLTTLNTRRENTHLRSYAAESVEHDRAVPSWNIVDTGLKHCGTDAERN